MKVMYTIALLLASATAYAFPVQISTKTLPNGVINTKYSAAVDTIGGCVPYTWTTSGTFPTGVAATRTTGNTLQITGTPTVATSYTFSVKVEGCGGHTYTRAYTVSIQQPNHTVKLDWDASTSKNIQGYNVYRGTGTTYSKIASLVAATDYIDSSVADGTTYNYVATAVNTSDEESQYSSKVTVTVP